MFQLQKKRYHSFTKACCTTFNLITISTISTSNTGGAGIAALRLHKSLNQQKLVSSTFINTVNENSNEKIVRVQPSIMVNSGEHLINRIHRKINRTLKTNLPLFIDNLTRFKSKINNYTLNCEIASLPFSQFKVEKEPTLLNSDLIHLHWVAECINYPTFFKSIKKPIVWTLHDMNPFQGIFHYKNDEINNPSISKIDKEIQRLKNTFIHRNQNIHIVCLTDWMYQASKNSAILGGYPHYLIPNGLDFTQFKTALSKDELKATYSINNNNKTLLFISQDIKNPRKGFDLLKNSLDLITDTPFNVVTVGNNQVELPTNFNHIHFNHIEDLSELNELYTLADLFLLPSREDNLPNVMLESFANGTPIISFNTGGMKDWVVPYKNGILVDDFSTKQFAQELLNFANNNYIFDAEYIRSYAEQNFNQLEQTKKYTELYQNILNK